MTERRYIVLDKPGDFAAYLRDRMRAHRRLQHRMAEEMTHDIFDEVVEALAAHTVEREQKSQVLPFPETKERRAKAAIQ